MKSSKRSVKHAIRSRKSSKPKLMAGRLSAIEVASAVENGGRMALVERDGSKRVDIVMVCSCQRKFRRFLMLPIKRRR